MNEIESYMHISYESGKTDMGVAILKKIEEIRNEDNIIYRPVDILRHPRIDPIEEIKKNERFKILDKIERAVRMLL